MKTDFNTEVNTYFEECKKILQIPKSWRVTLIVSPDMTEYANVGWNFNRKRFTITINPLRNKNIEEMKDSIIHELLHILYSPTSNRLEKVVSPFQVRKFNTIEEKFVRHLTKVIMCQRKGRKHVKK